MAAVIWAVSLHALTPRDGYKAVTAIGDGLRSALLLDLEGGITGALAALNPTRMFRREVPRRLV